MANNSQGKNNSVDDIGGRIRDTRKRAGLSQVDFAASLAITQGFLSAVETGKNQPTAELLTRLANIYQADINWLLTGKSQDLAQRIAEGGPPITDEDPELDGGEYIKIPRYEVAASAGGGAVIHSEQVVDYLSFRADWVRVALGVPPQNLALISVIGDSMEPNLSDGDVVLLDMTTRSVLDGSIYALQLNGGLLVKRIQRRLDGSVAVKSDNPCYDQEVVSGEMADQLRIVGRVIWVGRRL